MIHADASLSNLRELIDTDGVFVSDGIITVGVPLGTDNFVSKYVSDKCRLISDDVEPLTDGFVHYQILRFCQATRLQYLNAHVPKYDLTSFQQAQVDVKITHALLKKGHPDLWSQWSQADRDWVKYRLHESHDHGGFAITPNSLTRISAFYSSTGRFVAWGGQLSVVAQCNYFPAHDLTDPDTWRAPNLDRLKGRWRFLSHRTRTPSPERSITHH